MALAEIWGEEGWKEYMKKLAKQDPIMGMRGSHVAQRIISGERLIGNGGLHSVIRYKSQGKPLATASISPQGCMIQDLYSFKGCPHPNAAKLFMAWSMTPEAKETLVLTGYGYGPEKHKIIKEKGIKLIFEDTLEICKRSSRLTKIFAETMGFVPKKK